MESSRDDLIRLLALIAHELRSPLSVTSGYLKMLSGERMGPLAEPQQKAVVAAGASCDRLLALASDLSMLVRLENGEAGIDCVPVSGAAVVADSIAACVAADQHAVTIDANGGDDATVFVDPIRTRQSLSSLIGAVARAAPDGTAIKVSHTLDGNDGDRRLVVTIAPDSAADLEAARNEERLGPFDEWEGGLGIALPLARRFLALEGGDIRALATNASGLVVTLPVAANTRASV